GVGADGAYMTGTFQNGQDPSHLLAVMHQAGGSGDQVWSLDYASPYGDAGGNAIARPPRPVPWDYSVVAGYAAVEGPYIVVIVIVIGPRGEPIVLPPSCTPPVSLELAFYLYLYP